MTASSDHVDSREDLAAFVRALHRSHIEEGHSWENADLASFLEALTAWIEDADGWYSNAGRDLPADGDWSFFARALRAATTYEWSVAHGRRAERTAAPARDKRPQMIATSRPGSLASTAGRTCWVGSAGCVT
ncbi:DUF7660 family protein [Streptomyces nigra]